ncbi:MAG: PAS domain-containing protein, partial [Bacteroidota bacterium]
KSLLLKEKIIDVKSIEVGKLSTKLQKLEQELSLKNDHIRSACEEKDQLIRSLQHELDSKNGASTQITDRIGELEYHNRKYSYALRSAGFGLWDFNDSSEEFSFSSSWCEMFGFSQSKLTRDLETFILMIHPDDKKAFRRAFESILLKKTGDIKEEIRIVNRKDQFINVSFEGAYFKNEEDESILSGFVTFLHQDSNEMDEATARELAVLKEEITQKDKRFHLQSEELTQLQNATAREKLQNEQQALQINQLKTALEEKQVLLEIKSEELSQATSNQSEELSDELVAKETEISQLKEQLSKQAQDFDYLRLIAEKTENAIIITDQQGHIEFVNEAFEQITEYRKSEVLGRKPGTFLQGQDTDPTHIKAIRDGLASRQPFQQDILNYSKSGRAYWLSISMTPIFNTDGHLEKFIAVERDITKSKQRDDELAEAENELRKLMEDQFIQSEQLIEKEKQLSEALAASERARTEIENLSMVASKTDNAVIITDVHGSILYVNDGFERITEYNKEEVMGRKPGTFLQGPATNPEHVRAIREGINNQKPFTQEIL